MSSLDLPIYHADRPVTVAGSDITIRALQLAVWMCVILRHRHLQSDDRWFPAIVDLGHNHNLSLGANHLERWAGLSLSEFAFLRTVEVRYADGRKGQCALHDANVWISTQEHGQPRLKIELNQGFAFYSSGGPPVPLLGARALRTARIRLISDYAKLSFSIRRCVKPQLFGLWLLEKKLITRTQLDGALRQQTTQRLPLADISVLQDPLSVAQILRLPCEHRITGKNTVETAADVGLVSQIEADHLLNNTHDPETRIGELLVSMKAIGRVRMLAELDQFHRSMTGDHHTST